LRQGIINETAGPRASNDNYQGGSISSPALSLCSPSDPDTSNNEEDENERYQSAADSFNLSSSIAQRGNASSTASTSKKSHKTTPASASSSHKSIMAAVARKSSSNLNAQNSSPAPRSPALAYNPTSSNVHHGHQLAPLIEFKEEAISPVKVVPAIKAKTSTKPVTVSSFQLPNTSATGTAGRINTPARKTPTVVSSTTSQTDFNFLEQARPKPILSTTMQKRKHSLFSHRYDQNSTGADNDSDSGSRHVASPILVPDDDDMSQAKRRKSSSTKSGTSKKVEKLAAKSGSIISPKVRTNSWSSKTRTRSGQKTLTVSPNQQQQKQIKSPREEKKIKSPREEKKTKSPREEKKIKSPRDEKQKKQHAAGESTAATAAGVSGESNKTRSSISISKVVAEKKDQQQQKQKQQHDEISREKAVASHCREVINLKKKDDATAESGVAVSVVSQSSLTSQNTETRLRGRKRKHNYNELNDQEENEDDDPDNTTSFNTSLGESPLRVPHRVAKSHSHHEEETRSTGSSNDVREIPGPVRGPLSGHLRSPLLVKAKLSMEDKRCLREFHVKEAFILPR
jgi:hypothetical protein